MRKIITVLLAGIAIALMGCGGAAPEESTAPAAGSDPEISVSEAWARPSPMVAGNGAVYMHLTNSGGTADSLVGAATDIAEVVEIHESTMENDVMKMRPVEKIEVPAGGMAMLEPGGLHIMLINVKEKLEPGGKISLTLNFENSRPLSVDVEIKEMGMTDDSHDSDMQMDHSGN